MLRGIVDAVANPGGVSAERLQSVHDELEREGAFVDVGRGGREIPQTGAARALSKDRVQCRRTERLVMQQIG